MSCPLFLSFGLDASLRLGYPSLDITPGNRSRVCKALGAGFCEPPDKSQKEMRQQIATASAWLQVGASEATQELRGAAEALSAVDQCADSYV